MAEKLLQDLSLFLPEVVLAATVLLAILMDLIFRRTPAIVVTVVMAGLILAGVLVAGQSGLTASLFGAMVALDPFSAYFRILILLTSLFIVLFSLHSSELRTPGRSLGEYYAMIVALTLGMVLMTGANNLLLMYLAIELSSLTSYFLSGYTKEAPDSSEASLKYVIYGAVSSGLMLYGISLLYGLTGTLSFSGINEALPGVLAQGGMHVIVLLAGTVLILAGLGYKISAVPFHFWAPDVYEGAPITITAFLAVASKAAGFALLIRFFKTTSIDPAGSLVPGLWSVLQGYDWQQIVVILSVLTMTIGNLVAIWQNNLKRMLAYSSIAHAGYMLMGVVVLSSDGLTAVLVYFAVYLFMNLGAFYVVMLIANRTGSEDIEEYRGLGSRAPFMTVALAIFLISLTGLPPTAGFIGKLYLFAALINHGWVWLAVVGGVNTVVSLYYYVRVLRNMYLRADDQQRQPLAFGWVQTAVVLILLVPTLVLGIYFSPLVSFAQASVRMLGTP